MECDLQMMQGNRHGFAVCHFASPTARRQHHPSRMAGRGDSLQSNPAAVHSFPSLTLIRSYSYEQMSDAMLANLVFCRLMFLTSFKPSALMAVPAV